MKHLTELLPCPHCGDTPIQGKHENSLAGNGYFYIQCCALMQEGFILDVHKPKKKDSERFAQNEIVKRWNRRPK